MQEQSNVEDPLEEVVTCPKCTWTGPRRDLRHVQCLTLADDWWECPRCGLDAPTLIYASRRAAAVSSPTA